MAVHHRFRYREQALALLLTLTCSAAGSQPPDPFHGPEPTEAGEPEETEATVRALPLVHAEAESLAELPEEGIEALSEAGHASVDERTNTLVLHDTPERLATVEALVEQLDQPTRQVMIEARIVLASGDYARQLGSRLGLSTVRGDARMAFDSLPGGAGSGTDGLLAELPEIGDGKQLSIAIGEVGEHLLQLELSAMEAEGRGRIVSSPRVLTSERQEAHIEQGVQVPYQETAESGGTAVAFQDAALSLTATPQVGEDETVTLDLRVTKDAVGQIFEGVPSIDTQSVSTRLRVDAGETLVLGGVREQERHEQHRGVPWLADLPLIGWLFRERQQRSRHQELLVFVTPRLVSQTSPTDVDAPDARPKMELPPSATEVNQ
ncbi:MAG: secretin N-terminal domain-containing protein [Halorhodospira sp.]